MIATTVMIDCISLVIPVRNEALTLPRLLRSIVAQSRQPDEIVFVDGGSVDETVMNLRAAAASDARIRVIEAGDATPGRGRNIGIGAAKHQWIALTDAGISLEPTWLENLAAAAERDPDAVVVYGNYEPVEDCRIERWGALAFVPPKQERAGGRMRGPFIASTLIRREAWDSVGGFPDLRAAEDLIFMERLQGRRLKTTWAPKATVWWQPPSTLGRIFQRFTLYSKHNAWAGRQCDWHYGIARQYLAALFFVALAVAYSPWWLMVPALGGIVRVGKSIWKRREGRGLLWALHPVQFGGVSLVLATSDLATFVGWVQAAWKGPRPAQPVGDSVPTQSKTETPGP